MTNKEFLEKVSQKTNLGMDQVKDMSASLVSVVLEGIDKRIAQLDNRGIDDAFFN